MFSTILELSVVAAGTDVLTFEASESGGVSIAVSAEDDCELWLSCIDFPSALSSSTAAVRLASSARCCLALISQPKSDTTSRNQSGTILNIGKIPKATREIQ